MRDLNPPPARRRPGELAARIGALAVFALFAGLAYVAVTRLFARELASVWHWLRHLFA